MVIEVATIVQILWRQCAITIDGGVGIMQSATSMNMIHVCNITQNMLSYLMIISNHGGNNVCGAKV